MLNFSKILIIVLLFCYLVILLFGIVNFSFAQFSTETPPPSPAPQTPEKKDDTALPSSTGDFGLGVVEGTPKGILVDVFIKIANGVMGVVGVALVAMLIYGGVLYMTSAGSEERSKTAKAVLTYAIIGVVIVFAAYIIANFVIQAVG